MKQQKKNEELFCKFILINTIKGVSCYTVLNNFLKEYIKKNEYIMIDIEKEMKKSLNDMNNIFLN